MLKAFANAYAATLADPQLNTNIQLVKEALYHRNYEEAFNSPERLRAYIVRWSPARALAYTHIFKQYEAISQALAPGSNVLCIGGGAGAEIAALSNFPNVGVTVIDLAVWEPVVEPLTQALGTQVKVINDDALRIPFNPAEFDVITSLFTTNELFTQSKAGTLKFLAALTAKCRPGTLFVIIESAGSYSTVEVNGKTFPMQFFLDYTFKKDSWEHVYRSDAEWYRTPQEVEQDYPYKLENMRYMIRVYRHL